MIRHLMAIVLVLLAVVAGMFIEARQEDRSGWQLKLDALSRSCRDEVNRMIDVQVNGLK